MNTLSEFLKRTAKAAAFLLLFPLWANAQPAAMRVVIESAGGNEIEPIVFDDGELRVPLMSQPTAPYYVQVRTRDTRGNAAGVNEVTVNINEVWDDFAELFGEELPPSLGPVRLNYPRHVAQLIGPNSRPVTPNPVWDMIRGVTTFSHDFLLTLTRPRSDRGGWKRVISLAFSPNLTLVDRGPQPETGAVVINATSATLFSSNIGGQSFPASGILWQLPQTPTVPAMPNQVLTVTAIGGDTDFDGDVDFADFLALSTNYEKTGTWREGDFDGDGLVTFADFLILSSNY